MESVDLLIFGRDLPILRVDLLAKEENVCAQQIDNRLGHLGGYVGGYRVQYERGYGRGYDGDTHEPATIVALESIEATAPNALPHRRDGNAELRRRRPHRYAVRHPYPLVS